MGTLARLKPHDRVLVVGITGSGKSHFVKERIVTPAKRVVVWDPHAEYAVKCDLDEVCFWELQNEPELLKQRHLRLSIVPEWDDIDELVEQLCQLVRLLRRSRGKHTTTLVIEECGVIRPRGDGVLGLLSTQARHWNVPLVMVAQRAAQVPPTAREQVSRIISFRQSSPDDIAALTERIGDVKGSKIASLPRRHFVTWSESDAFKTKGEPK